MGPDDGCRSLEFILLGDPVVRGRGAGGIVGEDAAYLLLLVGRDGAFAVADAGVGGVGPQVADIPLDGYGQVGQYACG